MTADYLVSISEQSSALNVSTTVVPIVKPRKLQCGDTGLVWQLMMRLRAPKEMWSFVSGPVK